MSKTTIIVADDQPLIRDGLSAILGLEGSFSVLAKAEDGLSAIELVRLHRPNLVLMDIHMPGVDGLQATKQIAAELPDTKILILSTFEDDEYVWEAIRLGASGFLVKGTDTAKIIATIRDCLEGRISYPHSIQARLMRELGAFGPGADTAAASEQENRDEFSDKKLQSLTAQERNIVKSLAQGKSNQAIANELYLTVGTVKNYLYSIYKKLDVSSRAEAITYLHRAGSTLE